MSQSDYLRYKKIYTQINDLNSKKKANIKTPKVINSQDYILYKQFTLENTVKIDSDGNKLKYYNLLMDDVKIIFDMEKNVIGCPIFCNNNNQNINDDDNLLI